MRTVKIQWKGQFALTRDGHNPLPRQIASRLQESIDTGSIAAGTRLPSTRQLASELGVSRNTALAAYEELAAYGYLRTRRGAGVYAQHPRGGTRCDVRSVMRDAQFPAMALELRDPDGNPIVIGT